MKQIREQIWLKSNKAKESTEGDFLQRGFGCAQQHTPAQRHAGTDERAEKRGLGCSSYWENAHWTTERDAEGRFGFLGPMCQDTVTPCFGSSSWDFCFSLGQRESWNCYPPAVTLRHWLCNRTWLQQMQKHFFAELCIWTWTQDDSLWLCSFWTNYTALWDATAQGVSSLELSVMATMCNRDLNTLKCQGGGDSRFWSVSFCAENPIEFS